MFEKVAFVQSEVGIGLSEPLHPEPEVAVQLSRVAERHVRLFDPDTQFDVHTGSHLEHDLPHPGTQIDEHVVVAEIRSVQQLRDETLIKITHRHFCATTDEFVT